MVLKKTNRALIGPILSFSERGLRLFEGGTLIVFANFSRGYAYLGGYAY